MGGARYLWRHNLNYVGAGAAHCGSQRCSRDAPRGYTSDHAQSGNRLG